MRWSENETYQFVQLYLNQEYLWNTEHENYKVKEKRLQAYRDIVTEFYSSTGISLSVSELKAKIKNLRSTYTQELSKIKQRSNPDYKYTPTMKWFACWHKRFKRNSCTNQITDLLYEEPEKDNTKMWHHYDPDSFNDQTHLQPFVPETSDDYILLLKNEPEEQLFQKTDTQPYQIKRKKLKHRSSSTASDGSVQGSLDSNVDLSKEDEFDIYGKFIASQLRTMDLKKALKLQLQIQGLVSEARLSDLSNG